MLERNWDAMKRPLLILTILRQGPASKKALMKAVQLVLPESYQEGNEKSQERTFERDLENVRHRLGATVEWHPKLREYVLHDPGPYVQSSLPEEALQGFAFLQDSFTTSAEIQAVIRPLLDWVTQSVPDEQMRKMTHHSAAMQLNIQRISEGDIHPDVWKKVIYAIKQRRVIEFQYTSPFHEKYEPRRHRVEPYEHYFRNGHFYLKAYCIRWVAPNGFEGGAFWSNPYRLDYILPDEIALLRTFTHRELKKATIPIRYKLSPQIARGGISRYFPEMEVGKTDENGWVEVTAVTDNEFEAYRTLLGYGDQCVVLEPTSLVGRMREAIGGMLNLYPNLD